MLFSVKAFLVGFKLEWRHIDNIDININTKQLLVPSFLHYIWCCLKVVCFVHAVNKSLWIIEIINSIMFS